MREMCARDCSVHRQLCVCHHNTCILYMHNGVPFFPPSAPPPSFVPQHWLDPYKLIKKQVNRGNYSFRFRVKLYPISPIYLFEEATRSVMMSTIVYSCTWHVYTYRYFLALQIKEDLANEK